MDEKFFINYSQKQSRLPHISNKKTTTKSVFLFISYDAIDRPMDASHFYKTLFFRQRLKNEMLLFTDSRKWILFFHNDNKLRLF